MKYIKLLPSSYARNANVAINRIVLSFIPTVNYLICTRIITLFSHISLKSIPSLITPRVQRHPPFSKIHKIAESECLTDGSSVAAEFLGEFSPWQKARRGIEKCHFSMPHNLTLFLYLA